LKLDLNLLTVFDAVLRTRSVTRAAESLGLNQSSTSNALQRLRDTFGDPLFVRSGNQMVPTPLAAAMAESVHNALHHVGHALQAASPFEPLRSDRMFRIAVNDLGQVAFMPKLMAYARKFAPGVTLETVNIDPRIARQSLAEGGIDLVIGPLQDFGPDYHRQKLFADTLVCVVSAHHPTIRDELTLETYLDGAHGTYRPAGASHASIQDIVERFFATHRRKRRLVLRLAYTLGLGAVIESTDLIFTLPSGLALLAGKGAKIRVLPTPFKAPRFEISQEWHHRFHRDPGSRWLRQAVATLFRGKDFRELY
jgi:DNA-binding transcriptional LysR family regulator